MARHQDGRSVSAGISVAGGVVGARAASVVVAAGVATAAAVDAATAAVADACALTGAGRAGAATGFVATVARLTGTKALAIGFVGAALGRGTGLAAWVAVAAMAKAQASVSGAAAERIAAQVVCGRLVDTSGVGPCGATDARFRAP
jgi:hypothetical protein